MKDILLVFAGGGLGSIARFMVVKLFKSGQSIFPFATLTVNFLSCFLLGTLVMIGVSKMNLSESVKLLLITGFCGGFSTYSSFTFETVELFKQGQQGLGLSNIVLNFALSVSGLYLGFLVIKALG